MKAESVENLGLETLETEKSFLEVEEQKEFFPIEQFEKEFEQKHGPLTFGDSLRAKRDIDLEDRNFSEFAELLGISESRLEDLESGREIPTPKMAFEMAKTLKWCEKIFMELAIDDALRAEGLNYRVCVDSQEALDKARDEKIEKFFKARAAARAKAKTKTKTAKKQK